MGFLKCQDVDFEVSSVTKRHGRAKKNRPHVQKAGDFLHPYNGTEKGSEYYVCEYGENKADDCDAAENQ